MSRPGMGMDLWNEGEKEDALCLKHDHHFALDACPMCEIDRLRSVEERLGPMQEEVARLRRDLEGMSGRLTLLRAKEAALSWMVEYAGCERPGESEGDDGPCGACVPCMAARVLDGDLTALPEPVEEKQEAPVCAHVWEWDRSCGARVCAGCGEHLGLARCFCGWSRSGGDGAAELRGMGEVIDDG